MAGPRVLAAVAGKPQPVATHVHRQMDGCQKQTNTHVLWPWDGSTREYPQPGAVGACESSRAVCAKGGGWRPWRESLIANVVYVGRQGELGPGGEGWRGVGQVNNELGDSAPVSLVVQPSSYDTVGCPALTTPCVQHEDARVRSSARVK